MPGWGLSQYGLDTYGSVEFLAGGAIGTAPVILFRDPTPGAVNVVEDTLLTITFYDADLKHSTAEVYVDGVLAYSGVTGFQTGFVGIKQLTASTLIVQIYKRGGWGFEKAVRVNAYIEDYTARFLDETWTWYTRANPVCYSGITPTLVETTLTQPFIRFLGVEPLRKHMLKNVLRVGFRAIANDANKAARVVYQQAYSTELSVLQNAYIVKNATAIASVVCEQDNVLSINKTLNNKIPLINGAISDLKSQQVIDERYVREFADYLDTGLYRYRVSLAANLVLLAGAIETAEAA